MSQTTTTPNYGLIKPNVNADNDLWGDHWNANADTLDSKLKTIENKSGVVTWNTRSGTVSLLQADVTTVLPPGAGTPAMDGTATAGSLMTWSKSDHVHPTDTTRYAASNPAGYVTSAQATTAAPVQSVATRTGAVVLTHNDLTDWTATLAPYAPLASPALTGSPTAPTVTPSTDNSTKLATTAFVQSAAGVPSSAPPIMDGSAAPGVATTLSRGDHVHPSDTSRAPLASPTFTGSPTAPTPLPASDNSTNIATTAFVQAAVATALHDTGRNLLHNPLFNVAQRGNGPFSTNGYTLDRWGVIADTISVTRQGIADASRTQIGDEAAVWMLNSTFTGSAAAGGQAWSYQMVEDVRRLAGKTVTVSFWAVAASGTPKLGINLFQNMGTGGSPSAGAWVLSTGQSVTLSSTTFTHYTATVSIPTIIGKTVGSNNDSSTYVAFWYSAGSTSSAISGNIGVQSGTIFLWGVQLEIGSVATPLEKPDPRYDLANCQRFFEVGNFQFQSYSVAGSNNIVATQSFATPKRGAVTVTTSGTSTGVCTLSVDATTTALRVILATTGVGQAFALGNFAASADL